MELAFEAKDITGRPRGALRPMPRPRDRTSTLSLLIAISWNGIPLQCCLKYPDGSLDLSAAFKTVDVV